MKESMGKSVEGDIQQRQKTLPVIYAFRNSGSKDKAELERIYSQGDIQGENISTVVRILVQSGSRDYSQNLAEQYYHRSLEQLEASGVEKHRQAPLREMARFLLEREY